MPSITIKELDLTTAEPIVADENIVYVPGLAITGPVGKPTLCTTVEEFEKEFGSAPYMFEYGQYAPATTSEDAALVNKDSETGRSKIYDAGDVDLSYLYAKELLAAGLPVLYERVVDFSKIKETVVVNDQEITSTIDTIASYAVAEGEINNVDAGKYPLYKMDINVNGTIEPTYMVRVITVNNDGKDVITYYPVEGDLKNVVNFGEDSTPIVPVPNVHECVLKMYDRLAEHCIDNLENKSEYDVKYLTTGAYPTFEVEIEYSKTQSIQINADSENPENGCIVDITLLDQQKADKASKNEGGSFKKSSVDLGFRLDESEVASAGTLDNYGVKLVVMDPNGNVLTSNQYSAEVTTDAVEGDNKPNSKLNVTIGSNQYVPEIGRYGLYISFEVSSKLTANLAQKLLNVSATRGDTIALIDHTNAEDRPLVGMRSLYYSASVLNTLNNGEFGAMFTPWCNFTCSQAADFSSELDYKMPGSFAYLKSLAKSIQTNANWMAIAGVARGIVPDLSAINPLCTYDILTNTIAESYQPRNMISINPVTNIKPYGYTIWGNRTLKKNNIEGDLTATSFLNLRNLVCDVKKKVYAACKKLMFEQNSDILWINFQAEISPLLDNMKTGYGISNYKIVKVPSSQRGKLEAKVILYPIYAVEDFVVTVVLTDDEVTVE